MKNNLSSKEDLIATTHLITELLKKGVIVPCNESSGQFISSIFLVPKSDGSKRLILDLKELNKFVQTEHFKLENRKTVVNLISKGCFLATIDLKDAFHAVSVAEADRKFLRFRFNNILYEYTCLPFGLSTAPYVFTKILKPVVAGLRRQGFLSVIYLDDLLVVGRSFEDCQRNVHATCSLLTRLGFTLNKEKCQLNPSTRCKYLGFLFDSKEMSVELPKQKKEKVKVLVKRFSRLKSCRIRKFAEFVGTLISYCPAVAYGFVHTKNFERARYLALAKNNNLYDRRMTIDNHL